MCDLTCDNGWKWVIFYENKGVVALNQDKDNINYGGRI